MSDLSTDMDETIRELEAEVRELRAKSFFNDWQRAMKEASVAREENAALRAERDACAEYLKEGETPAECIKRNRDDMAAALKAEMALRANLDRLTAGTYSVELARLSSVNAGLRARVAELEADNERLLKKLAVYSTSLPHAHIVRLEAENERLRARVAEVGGVGNALLHQIDIGDFMDSHGHSAKMLKAVHDLRAALTTGEKP